MDFGGFDSSPISILRGGIPRPIGNFPESLSREMLVGIILVGKLGVLLTEILSARITRLASNRSTGSLLSNFNKRMSNVSRDNLSSILSL